MTRNAYLAGLRSRVGHRLLILPSVTLCIFDSAQRILLLRHVDSGRWATPGGMIEPGERPADAVVREAHEEIGVHAVPTELIGVFGGPEFHLSYSNGDQVTYVMTAFRCDIDARPEPDGVEVSEAKYVSSAEWQDLQVSPWMHAALPQIFSWVQAGRPSAIFSPPRTDRSIDGAS